MNNLYTFSAYTIQSIPFAFLMLITAILSAPCSGTSSSNRTRMQEAVQVDRLPEAISRSMQPCSTE